MVWQAGSLKLQRWFSVGKPILVAAWNLCCAVGLVLICALHLFHSLSSSNVAWMPNEKKKRKENGNVQFCPDLTFSIPFRFNIPTVLGKTEQRVGILAKTLHDWRHHKFTMNQQYPSLRNSSADSKSGPGQIAWPNIAESQHFQPRACWTKQLQYSTTSPLSTRVC